MFNKNSNTQMSTHPRAELRYSYVPVRENLESEELGSYVSYGISIRDHGTEISFVSDVSPELERVKAIADRCTEEQLDPIHVFDVIEDDAFSESNIIS